ncbi:hypothetical protein PABG_00691 [Paracoccidioides brasiliensis Pb03]|nr:hypothetical protein PABG_00691 [Paracoccidioides brasiliensis Pb03]
MATLEILIPSWPQIAISYSPGLIEVATTILCQILGFWLPCTLYLLIDLAFPTFSNKHKLQSARRQPTWAAITHCFRPRLHHKPSLHPPPHRPQLLHKLPILFLHSHPNIPNRPRTRHRFHLRLAPPRTALLHRPPHPAPPKALPVLPQAASHLYCAHGLCCAVCAPSRTLAGQRDTRRVASGAAARACLVICALPDVDAGGDRQRA